MVLLRWPGVIVTYCTILSTSLGSTPSGTLLSGEAEIRPEVTWVRGSHDGVRWTGGEGADLGSGVKQFTALGATSCPTDQTSPGWIRGGVDVARLG